MFLFFFVFLLLYHYHVYFFFFLLLLLPLLLVPLPPCPPQVDKVLASCLPYGQYPLLPPHTVTVICRLSWLLSFAISITVNTKYSCSYEPAVVLCIPVLPLGFFVFASSLVCLIIIIIVVGFLGSIIYLKKVSPLLLFLLLKLNVKKKNKSGCN